MDIPVWMLILNLRINNIIKNDISNHLLCWIFFVPTITFFFGKHDASVKKNYKILLKK